MEQCVGNVENLQVAQLSQRDSGEGWVSFGQKWKTGNGRRYFADIIGHVFNHCNVIGLHLSNSVKQNAKMVITPFKVI